MNKKTTVVIVAAALLGLWLALGIIRFALIDNHETHYHANFAVYVNGSQLEFDNPLYYEEVGSGCSLDENSAPQERAHLHDSVGSVVHVHDTNVTWGHFFNNIDYSIGEFHLETWEDVFADDSTQQVRYILNGQIVNDVKNLVIEDEAALLIDISSGSEAVLQQRYASIPTDAAEFNTQPDPSACKGSSISLAERLKKAFLAI